jgi:triosephosphate isomerase
MSTRKKIVAGNHKMFTTLPEGMALAKEIHRLSAKDAEYTDVVIFPPATHVFAVSGILRNTPFLTGAQNCSAFGEGAYTGEISAIMAKSAGADYVLVGHSERRHIFGERDEELAEKIKQARKAGLKVIFCVGETLDERESGTTEQVITSQLSLLRSLAPFSAEELELAYEPVWAIGTGKTAGPDQAQEVHEFIRRFLQNHFGDMSEKIRILYGGSVKPENSGSLLACPDVDGLLVGGASLNAESFAAIIKSASV